jgi:hypothetical protein
VALLGMDDWVVDGFDDMGMRLGCITAQAFLQILSIVFVRTRSQRICY